MRNDLLMYWCLYVWLLFIDAYKNHLNIFIYSSISLLVIKSFKNWFLEIIFAIWKSFFSYNVMYLFGSILMWMASSGSWLPISNDLKQTRWNWNFQFCRLQIGIIICTRPIAIISRWVNLPRFISVTSYYYLSNP